MNRFSTTLQHLHS